MNSSPLIANLIFVKNEWICILTTPIHFTMRTGRSVTNPSKQYLQNYHNSNFLLPTCNFQSTINTKTMGKSCEISERYSYVSVLLYIYISLLLSKLLTLCTATTLTNFFPQYLCNNNDSKFFTNPF